MSRIAIVPLQELGHIVPAIYVAKRLRAQGHDVAFVGLEDWRTRLESEGFEFFSLCKHKLPVGSLRKQHEHAAHATRAVVAQAREHQWIATASRSLLAGHEDDLLRAMRADLFLVDRVWEDPMLVLTDLRQRVALYTVILWAHPTLKKIDTWDPESPPPSTMSTPRWGALRAQRRVEWTLHSAREAVAWAARERESFTRGAARLAWLGRRRRRLERLFLQRSDAFRTLILCPAELDFARAPRPWRVYGGPCIDIERHDGDLEIARDARPLVYCAVGSQGQRIGRDLEFLRACIEASRGASWRLVMSVGDWLAPSLRVGLPENVTVHEHVPQLRILEKSGAAIVHGGLGTIKECIWFGVPMLVLPGHHDQPGNAARVAHHGLGVAQRRDQVTAAHAREVVQGLLEDRERRNRLDEWSRHFRAIQSEERETEFVRTMLARSI